MNNKLGLAGAYILLVLAALAGCGGGGDSSTPTVAPPIAAITAQPTDKSVVVGTAATFSVVASNASGYQWQSSIDGGTSFTNVSAATNASHTTAASTLPDSGAKYRVVVAGAGNSVTSSAATLTVTAAVVAPSVTGVLVGPVGAQVVLLNNAADNLSVTVTPDAVAPTDNYAQTAFTFVTKLPDGAAYSVSVATAPADQTCKPFAGATGIMPVAARKIWVGCEFNFDHLVRNTNDTVVGGYSGSQNPMLGGSNVSIGATPAYGEGRFAVFISSIAGIAGSNTSANRQVFWRDRATGETILVSASAAGIEGNGFSYDPVLSADGLTVAFESLASNLVSNDTNSVGDIFVWSAAARAAGVQRASVGANGVQTNGDSHKPSLSGDGKVVAFTSRATNLTAGETGSLNAVRVYRRDLTTGINTLVSKNASGASQDGGNPVLSEDGNRLAFSTYWPLLASDVNWLWDIYVYEHSTASLKRVSLTSTDAERNQGTESASRSVAPAISGDGQYVAYASTATNVVPGDANGLQHVFVVNVETGSVVRASVSSTGVQGDANSPVGQGERPSLSADGKWVAFTTAATNLAGTTNVVLRNWETNETRAMTAVVTGASGSGPVSMTRTGAYVAFWSGTPLDAKFSVSGLFARFTGLQRAFTWIEN